MTVNQAVALYWEIFKKPIIDNSTPTYEYIEIRVNSVNLSQQLNYNFILKVVEPCIFRIDCYFYAKANIARTGRNKYTEG